MIEKLNMGLVAAVCVALAALPAFGANVFFSTVGNVGGGVAVGNPEVTAAPGENLTLTIWSTDDQDYDTTIGMNIVATPTGVIAFTAAVAENPELLSNVFDPPQPTGMFRWQGVGVLAVDANVVRNLAGVEVNAGGGGVTTNNDGMQGPLKYLDPLYDLDAGAFHLGSVSFDVIGDPGATTTLTINQENTALFVNGADPRPHHGGLQIFPDFGTATIHVTARTPGDRPDNPVIPDETAAGGVEIFNDVPLDQLTSLNGVEGLWFDPPSIRSLRVEITDGVSTISDVGLPGQGSGPGEYPDSDGLYGITAAAGSSGVVDVNVNQIHSFASGVTDFTITGVDSFLPADEAADLPIFLAFGQSNGGKVSLQITRIPEPSGFVLAAIGLLCFWPRSRGDHGSFTSHLVRRVT